MDIRFETLENTVIIHLEGELDHHWAKDAKARIDFKLSMTLKKNVVYDLQALTFMDSSGIGLIASGYKIVENFSGKVYIITENEKFIKIFNMAGINEMATILRGYSEEVLI
jgi:stage II sporulation protein AA (anti-sigma F factor antagonist)